MSETVKHTPIPWFADGHAVRWRPREDQPSIVVARASPLNREADSNAELIARAVNSYGEMLAALKEIDASEAAYEGNAEDDERCRNAVAAVRAAIAKAEARASIAEQRP